MKSLDGLPLFGREFSDGIKLAYDLGVTRTPTFAVVLDGKADTIISEGVRPIMFIVERVLYWMRDKKIITEEQFNSTKQVVRPEFEKKEVDIDIDDPASVTDKIRELYEDN